MPASLMHFLLAVEDNSLIESKATLDEFALAMKAFCQEAAENPNYVKKTLYNPPVLPFGEIKASGELKVRWQENGG